MRREREEGEREEGEREGRDCVYIPEGHDFMPKECFGECNTKEIYCNRKNLIYVHLCELKENMKP